MRNAPSAGPASHAIASDTRGGGRSDPTGRVLVRLHPLAGRSGVGGHRSPTKAAATRRRVLVRLACALGGRVSCASWSSSLPVPSVGSARKQKARTPERSNRTGTRPPGPWRYARRSTTPAPQSKPVTPASRLVAQVAPSVASGLGLRLLAAGPARCATLLLLQAPARTQVPTSRAALAGGITFAASPLDREQPTLADDRAVRR
jgi:hypothetical protein